MTDMEVETNENKDNNPLLKPDYEEGEKVLCFHGPLIYEAKCLQFDLTDSGDSYEYYVHYIGWNKNWDEWVPHDRILKYNDANLKKQQDLINAQKQNKAKKSRRSIKEIVGKDLDKSVQSPASSVSSSTPRGQTTSSKKSDTSSHKSKDKDKDAKARITRSRLSSVDDVERITRRSSIPVESTPLSIIPKVEKDSDITFDDVSNEIDKKPEVLPILENADQRKSLERIKPVKKEEEENMLSGRIPKEIKIKMNERLKDFLATDWCKCTCENLLVKVPSGEPVDKILNDFLMDTEIEESLSTELRQEVVDGMKWYFQTMIESALLYPIERGQLKKIYDDFGRETDLCLIYGPVHLVRFFVKLGWALQHSGFDKRSTDVLLNTIQELVSYIEGKADFYLNIDEYICTEE